MSFISQTYRNIFSGSFSVIFVGISSLILTPIILNNLGKELYGLWLVLFNFLAYFYLVDFGITNAIVRLVAKYNATRESDLGKLISTIYILITVLACLLLTMLVQVRDPIFLFLEIDESLSSAYNLLFFIGILEVTTQLILRVNIGILKGNHRYDIAYKIESLGAVFRIITILFLVTFGLFNLVSFAIAYSLIKVLCDSVSFFYIRERIQKIRFIIDFSIIKELTNIGSSSLLITIFGFLINSVPIVLFCKIFGLAPVVLYSIPFAMTRIITRVINTIYNGVNPKASELKALDNEILINNISSFGVKIASIISLSIFGFFIIFGEELLRLWLGSSIIEDSDFLVMFNLLIVLLFFLFLETTQKVNIFIYKSSGFHWYVTLESLISVVCLYLFSFFLFDYLGLYIFAFALVLTGLIKYIFYKFILSKYMKTYSLSVAVLTIMTLYCLLLFCVNLILLDSFVEKLIVFLGWVFGYMTVCYFYLLNSDEKNLISNQLNIISSKIK